MNNRAIAKIQRNNHLNHLTRVLPLIVMVFGIQCFVISEMNPETNIGNYALLLAATLSSLIGSMIYYDTYHTVLLYEDHMTLELKFFGQKRINYSEIKEVITTADDVSFSGILLKFENGKRHILHFVDYPKETKALIEKLKTPTSTDLAA